MSENKKEENLSHVKCIELLVNSISEHMMGISPETAKEYEAYDDAEVHITSWQRQQLYKLRKVFE